jgi:nitroreductase
MDIYEALYTTRAMRRVRPDPIPLDVQARILDAAIRAPNGGNQQGWRFMLVDDPEVKSAIAPLYHDSISRLWETIYAPQVAAFSEHPEDPANAQFAKVQRSAQWLADHFAEVPLYLFAFTRGDRSGGSIFPALWSAMLAARAEGVGTCLTTVLGLRYSQEVLDILGVPADKGWTMSACVSMGYPTGRWGLGPRHSVEQVSYRNRWGEPVGFDLSTPLWSGATGN